MYGLSTEICTDLRDCIDDPFHFVYVTQRNGHWNICQLVRDNIFRSKASLEPKNQNQIRRSERCAVNRVRIFCC